MSINGNDWELLSKAQVIREYQYPEHLLNEDINAGEIAAFLPDGASAKGKGCLYGVGRYYIPRISVEARIAARAGLERKP